MRLVCWQRSCCGFALQWAPLRCWWRWVWGVSPLPVSWLDARLLRALVVLLLLSQLTALLLLLRVVSLLLARVALLLPLRVVPLLPLRVVPLLPLRVALPLPLWVPLLSLLLPLLSWERGLHHRCRIHM